MHGLGNSCRASSNSQPMSRRNQQGYVNTLTQQTFYLQYFGTKHFIFIRPQEQDFCKTASTYAGKWNRQYLCQPIMQEGAWLELVQLPEYNKSGFDDRAIGQTWCVGEGLDAQIPLQDPPVRIFQHFMDSSTDLCSGIPRTVVIYKQDIHCSFLQNSIKLLVSKWQFQHVSNLPWQAVHPISLRFGFHFFHYDLEGRSHVKLI